MDYSGGTFIFLLLSLIFSALAGLRNVSLNALRKAGKENVNYLNHIVTKHSRVGMLSAIFFIVHLVLASNITLVAWIVLGLMVLSGLFAVLSYQDGKKYLKVHQVVAGLSLIAIFIYFFI